MKQNEYSKQIAELEARSDLIRRLQEQGIRVIHSRLHGTEISVPDRNGVAWEGYSNARARELLAEREEPSRLDIANAKFKDKQP